MHPSLAQNTLPTACNILAGLQTTRDTFHKRRGPSGDAYLTDSVRPILFKFEGRRSDIVGGVGEIEEWLNLEGTP